MHFFWSGIGPWWLTVTVSPVITDNSLTEKRKVLTTAAFGWVRLACGCLANSAQSSITFTGFIAHGNQSKNCHICGGRSHFHPLWWNQWGLHLQFQGKCDSSCEKWPVAVKMKNSTLKNTLPFQSYVWVLSILTNQTFLILNHFVFVVRFPLSVSLYRKCNNNTAGIILAGSWHMAPL